MSQKLVCSMVGMKYRGSDRLVQSLPNGVNLKLVRDAGNEHDNNAVQVWFESKHVAFIARDEVVDVAKYMDKQHIDTMPARLVFVSRYPNAEVLI